MELHRWEMNSIVICLAGLVCVMLGIWIVKWKRRKLPPGPASLPIFGSVRFFKEFKHKRHHVLTEMSEKYGKIFSVRAGGQLVVFINGYQLIREAFLRQGDAFADRPNWLPSLQQGLADGKGLVWQDGCHAIRVRKFAHQALREFGVGKTSLEQRIMVEVGEITSYLNNNLDVRIQLKPLMKKSITNIIHDIVFGERFHYDDTKLSEVVTLLEDFFKGGLFLPKNFLPRVLCKLLPKDEKAYQEKQVIMTKLRQYIYDYISRHEEVYSEGGDVNDFIDLYIKSARDTDQEGGEMCLSQGDIFRTILDLFLAGSETTATTLEWCFLYMAQYPLVQESCFREIQKVLYKSNANETHYSDRRSMPYVEATLSEVQRLATIDDRELEAHCYRKINGGHGTASPCLGARKPEAPSQDELYLFSFTNVPVGLPHVTSRATEIGGYIIPERTIVFGNLYSCLMDPTVWDKPTEFIPERHLDDKGNVKRTESLIPFSIGPRACLGETMARMETFLVFTDILNKFEFSRGREGDAVTMETKKDYVINTSQGFDVVVRQRLRD